MVDVGSFISRIEVLVSGNFIIFGLMKVTVCLYVGSRGLARVLGGKSYRPAAALATAGMIVFSQRVFTSTMQMFAFLQIYKRYAPVFEIVLPLAVFIGLACRPAAAQNGSADPAGAENGSVSL